MTSQDDTRIELAAAIGNGLSMLDQHARSAWARSFALALVLHIGLLGAALSAVTLASPNLSGPRIEQLIRGTLVLDDPVAPRPSADSSFLPSGSATAAPDGEDSADASEPSPTTPPVVEGTVLEPDPETIRRATEALSAAPPGPPTPDLYDRLSRDAATLERISNPEEVSRMAAAIRKALDVEPVLPPTTQAVGDANFDFERSVLADAQRITTPDSEEFHETLVDPVGRKMTIITRQRRSSGVADAIYEQTLLEPGKPSSTHLVTKEEFEEAMARHHPFEVINRFPLVKLLHQEAVLPLLRKMGEEPPPTSQPARPATQPTQPNPAGNSSLHQ